jgi:hypothetical protein
MCTKRCVQMHLAEILEKCQSLVNVLYHVSGKSTFENRAADDGDCGVRGDEATRRVQAVNSRCMCVCVRERERERERARERERESPLNSSVCACVSQVSICERRCVHSIAIQSGHS